MNPRDEDELWREIIEHYGDEPSVDRDDRIETPEGDPAPAPEPDDSSSQEAPPEPGEYVVPPPQPSPGKTDPLHAAWADEGRFVPPPPPPIPVPDPPRLLAWAGLVGAPLAAVIGLVIGEPFRGILAVLLALAFVAGFVYLIKSMPQEPRDPGDDGARL